eukprot:snap_masked-scaffold_28-processed-gene-2.35-mRNA-1 protein AED:1.00 eAED:1.00 QI:0/0/0/0/1/1/6/0/529
MTKLLRRNKKLVSICKNLIASFPELIKVLFGKQDNNLLLSSLNYFISMTTNIQTKINNTYSSIFWYTFYILINLILVNVVIVVVLKHFALKDIDKQKLFFSNLRKEKKDILYNMLSKDKQTKIAVQVCLQNNWSKKKSSVFSVNTLYLESTWFKQFRTHFNITDDTLNSSFFIFHESSRIRKTCIYLTTSKYWNPTFLCVILLSSLTLIFDSPIASSYTKYILSLINNCILFAFLFELICLTISNGLLFPPSGHLQQLGNCIDTFLVFSVIVSKLVQLSGSSSMGSIVRLLRTFRLIRPLRLVLRSSRSTRKLMEAVSLSISSVGYTFLILCVYLFIFSLLSLEMFNQNNTNSTIEQDFNYDNIFNSLFTNFEALTLSSWTEKLYYFYLKQINGTATLTQKQFALFYFLQNYNKKQKLNIFYYLPKWKPFLLFEVVLLVIIAIIVDTFLLQSRRKSIISTFEYKQVEFLAWCLEKRFHTERIPKILKNIIHKEYLQVHDIAEREATYQVKQIFTSVKTLQHVFRNKLKT